jgi:hypothetical protein
MRARLVSVSVVPALAASRRAPAWTRSYAIGGCEPTTRFGSNGGEADAGADSPSGPDRPIDWIEVLIDAGCPAEEVRCLRNLVDPTSTPGVGLPPVEGKPAFVMTRDGQTAQPSVRSFHRVAGVAPHRDFKPLPEDQLLPPGPGATEA